MLMPASHSSPTFHYLCGKHPGKFGWLFGPAGAKKCKLRPWVSFALDNDAFGAWVNKTPWDSDAWIAMLNFIRMTGYDPRWVLVPDVVADRENHLL